MKIKTQIKLGFFLGFLFFLPGTVFPQSRPRWGIRGDLGGLSLRIAANVFGTDGELGVSVNTYSLGLMRYYSRGTPNFSVGFSRTDLDFRATGSGVGGVATISYTLNAAAVEGLMFSKYATPLRFGRIYLGFAGGVGIGSLSFDYKEVTEKQSAENDYQKGDFSVLVPLFELLLRGEVNVWRFSLGPVGGIRNGIPFGGLSLSYRF